MVSVSRRKYDADILVYHFKQYKLGRKYIVFHEIYLMPDTTFVLDESFINIIISLIKAGLDVY